MKHLRLVFALLTGVVSACVVENSLPSIMKMDTATDCTIPIDVALNSLTSYLQGTNQSTRTIGLDLENVITLSSSDMTRSDGSSLPSVDSLLYLVNFENNSGYAILAADARIEAPIIAITESGSITAQDFCFAQGYSDGELRGGGDDIDDGSGSDSGGNNLDNGSGGSGFINGLIVDFVSGSLEGGSNSGGGSAGYTPSDGSTVRWFVKPPILTTIWGQEEPYNLKCPMIGDSLAPAGCVAIAVGQVLAHFKPDDARYNNHTYDWDVIKSVGRMEDMPAIVDSTIRYTDIQKDKISTFIRDIGDICDMNYNESVSTTVPWKIDNCLQLFGFNESDLYWTYDSESMISSVIKGDPVIISGSHCAKGHTWVIDGYHYKTNPDNENQYILFHCNWGWDGWCNGYYYSKVFDLSEGPIINEDKYGDVKDTTRDRHYNWIFSRVILNTK